MPGFSFVRLDPPQPDHPVTRVPSKAPPAPRVLVMVVPDLFFATRIGEAARAGGVTLIPCPASQALEVCRAERPDLIIVDLQGRDDPLDMVRALKADPAVSTVPIVGFYSHVDQETRRAAGAAGVDLVLPRSAFTARLGELLTGLPGPTAD